MILEFDTQWRHNRDSWAPHANRTVIERIQTDEAEYWAFLLGDGDRWTQRAYYEWGPSMVQCRAAQLERMEIVHAFLWEGLCSA